MTTIITYNQLKMHYDMFKNNLPKDEYKRLAEELRLVRNLMKFAKHENKLDDLPEYEKTQDEIVKKLTEMGYKVLDW